MRTNISFIIHTLNQIREKNNPNLNCSKKNELFMRVMILNLALRPTPFVASEEEVRIIMKLIFAVILLKTNSFITNFLEIHLTTSKT